MTTPRSAPIAHMKRVGLSSVVRTAKKQPMRILLHGVEKIGKTSFAAEADAPIFIGPEDGLPPAKADTPHFGAPEGGWRWLDILDAVRSLAIEEHDRKTLVLDTLDWIEPILWRHLCQTNGWDSIESPGYGKGYTAAIDEWRRLMADLEQLRRAKDMHVIVLAHSHIKNFKDPESEGWDRYQLKLNDKAAGVWKEWVDAVLFAKHEQALTKDARTKRVRGISTGARIIYTTHNAAYDAGNRYELPDEIPLDWTAFVDAVEAHRPADPAQLRAAIESLLTGLDDVLAAKVRAAVVKANNNASELARIHNKLVAGSGSGGAADAAKKGA